VANNDRTVHPESERFVAKRMDAAIHSVDSSHVTKAAQVIVKAADALSQ